MLGFIDTMRAEGRAVESICRVLREQGCQIAARTCRAWERGTCAARTVTDAKVVDAVRAGDLLNRDFTAPRPDHTWVMDFTYVRTLAGWVCVALIVDVFSQRIVAWHAQTTRHVELVMIPLRMGLWERDRQGHPIRPEQLRAHSDSGSQGGFNRSSQHLDLGGVWWQVQGSRGRRGRWERGGSGRRIGRCARRCGPRAGRNPRGRSSVSSGG